MKMKPTMGRVAVWVVAGFVLLGSMTGLAVARSGSTGDGVAPQETEEQSPNYKGSISVPQGQDDDDVSVENEQEGNNENQDESAEEASAEAAEDAALAAKAKISADEALAAAEAAQPGYTAEAPELGNENGYLVYEVEMTNSAGKSLEVKVDAGNGKILSVEDGSEDDDSSSE